MLVMLDKDGVINTDIPETGVIEPSQVELIPGSARAIKQLNRFGIKVAIVTNQSAIGKGLITEDECKHLLNIVYQKLQAEGAHWDAIYYCPDAPAAPTRRRKPEPGMLSEALRDFEVPPAHTPFVGDALTDLQAATAAGCPRYIVRTGKGEKTLENPIPDACRPYTICDDLEQAVGRILQDFQWLLKSDSGNIR